MTAYSCQLGVPGIDLRSYAGFAAGAMTRQADGFLVRASADVVPYAPSANQGRRRANDDTVRCSTLLFVSCRTEPYCLFANRCGWSGDEGRASR